VSAIACQKLNVACMNVASHHSSAATQKCVKVAIPQTQEIQLITSPRCMACTMALHFLP